MILFFIAIVFFSSIEKINPSGKKSQSSSLENYIKQCIKSTSEYGIYLFGIHGGKIYTSNGKMFDEQEANPDPIVENMFLTDVFKIRYAYNSNTNSNSNANPDASPSANAVTFPSLIESKKELEKYIDSNLNSGTYSCIKDLRTFKNQYDKISVWNVASEVTFADEVTLIDINMSVVLEKGDVKKTYKRFSESIPVRYKRIHGFVERLVSYTNAIPFGYGQNGEIKVYFTYYPTKNTEFYAIVDTKSKLENKNYIFFTSIEDIRDKISCVVAS